MLYVWTLVSHKLKQELANRSCKLVAQYAFIVDSFWLAKGEAFEIHFQTSQIIALKQAILVEKYPVDSLVTLVHKRKKKIFISDLDSTIIPIETIDELAKIAGYGKRSISLTTRAMAGKMDFEEALRKRVALLQGLSIKNLEDVVANTPINPGAKTLLRTLKKFHQKTILVSGGFSFIAKAIAEKLDFDCFYANHLVVENSKLNGKLTKQIISAKSKATILEQEVQKQNLQNQDVLAVGDGANDLPMLQKAGLGVAYYAKPKVKEIIKVQINHSSLTSLLYFQGIKQQDFC